MSDKDSKPPSSPGATEREAGAPQPSGRVGYDAKGNPIWQWETSTGVFGQDVSTQRLKKLEASLSLEETQSLPKPKDLSLQEPERLPGGGMNPYDTGNSSERTAPAKHPALVHKQASRKPQSNSLVSKYATTKKTAAHQPQGLWQKLKSLLSRD